MMAPARPKILIADDDRNVLRIIELALSDEHFQLIFAEDGPNALAIAEKERPDMVILDIRLPGVDGFEVLKTLRGKSSQGLYDEMVIILLSSASFEKTITQGFKEGADDFITKPFSPGNLKSRVKSWLIRKGITVS
ncbi:MAG: response regulator [Candidatus Eremiobacteraeota bacterium]|nr:response regulator [Candidatus Eremiobacteraeota bacterium]